MTLQTGSLTNLSGGALTGGTYIADAGGTIELPSDSPVTTLAG